MKTKLNDQAKPIRISYWQRRIIYICPKCGKPVAFGKLSVGRSLCIRCGQRLDWSPVEKIHTEMLTAENATDAAIVAERYFNACGMEEKDWFNLDDFRRSLTERDPRKPAKKTELYLYFKDPKEYGRFKRMNGGKK